MYSTVIDIAREERGAISISEPLPPGTTASRAWDETLTLGDSLVDRAPSPEDTVVDQSSRDELKRLLGSHAQDERECAILYLKYDWGLTPAQVLARSPDLFLSIGDVYRVTRNLLDRLRRSPEMRRWFAES